MGDVLTWEKKSSLLKPEGTNNGSIGNGVYMSLPGGSTRG